LELKLIKETEDEKYLPRPFGVIYEEVRECYEDQLHSQVDTAKTQKKADLDTLFSGSSTWEI